MLVSSGIPFNHVVTTIQKLETNIEMENIDYYRETIVKKINSYI